MIFCSKCGKQNPEGTTFCPACGSAASAGANRQQGGNSFSGIMDTPEIQCDQADIEQNKILALFSYLGILFLIPLLAAPNSQYARFHTNQGLVLFLAGIVGGIAVGILSSILGFIPFLGALVSWLLGLAFSGVSIAFVVIGIINAVNGKAKELPLIGKFKLLK